MLKDPNNQTDNNNQDSPIYYSPWEFTENSFSMSFDNGLTVVVEVGFFIFVKIRILTPTLDITNRFRKLVGGNGLVGSPDVLIKLLNKVAGLPNVYTINDIPESCFDFNDCISKS